MKPTGNHWDGPRAHPGTDGHGARRYRDAFLAWSGGIERRLLRWIAVLAVLLALFQALLRIPEIRVWLVVDEAREGVPAEDIF